MRYQRASHRSKWLFAATLFGFALGLALFLGVPVSNTLASENVVRQTTVNDFNAGTLYHTGLSRDTAAGGDGDGEVRLLTIGIASNTWNKATGNVNGLPPLEQHAAVQKSSRIFVAGGRNDTDLFGRDGVYCSTILTATTHNLSNWSTTNSLPAARRAHAMVEVNNRLYVLGGINQTGNQTKSIFSATIDPISGPTGCGVSVWSTLTATLPISLSDFVAVVVTDTIYIIGGQNSVGTAQTSVYYAKPLAGSGIITGWTSTSAAYPLPVLYHAGTTHKGTIYVVGGTDNLTPTYFADVYYGTPTASGDITAWTSTPGTNMPGNIVNASAIAYGAQLYVVGGSDNGGTTFVSDVQSDLINEDATLFINSWANSPVLSTTRERTVAVLSDDGWIYVIEGSTGAPGSSSAENSIDYGPTAAAGATRYASSGLFTSSPIDVGGSYTILRMDWSAVISNPVTMTIRYRLGPTIDLSGSPWSAESYPVRGGATAITNTTYITTPSVRYLQYRVYFSTTLENQTPILNAVNVVYDLPPDLTIAQLDAPPQSVSTVTQTVTVYISNTAGSGILQRPVARTVTNTTTSPRSVRSPSYSFANQVWVDLYIDRTPTSVSDLGECFGSTQSIMLPNTQVAVLIDHRADGVIGCPISPGSHSFVAQVDTCDLGPAPNNCHKPADNIYGYVMERNENNNISPSTPSAPPLNRYFLPIIYK